MKIKIMTQDAVNYVRGNLQILLPHYINGDEPEIWLKEALGKSAFQEVPELEFDEFSLLTADDVPSSTDIPNIKLLYKKMQGLNDSFATDERLWAGLSHTLFYGYMQQRWPVKEAKDILNHYMFGGGRPRCYMVNSIARLWWLGKKTIDYNLQEPEKIIDYMAHDINGYAFTLFGSNWSNSQRTLNNFFNAIFRFETETGKKVGRGLFNDAREYANMLSGIYIIDACDDQFIMEKIYGFLNERSIEREQEAAYNKENNVRETGVARFDTIIKAFNRLGGHGRLKDLLKAYADIDQQEVSSSTRDYITRQLEENCPGNSKYVGKPYFFKIMQEGGGYLWKIANEYLTKENFPLRKKFVRQQIDNLEGNDLLTFNIITTINGKKVTFEDIAQYRQQLTEVYPDIEDIDAVLKKSLANLSQKGILESVDGTYKKAYDIKVN